MGEGKGAVLASPLALPITYRDRTPGPLRSDHRGHRRYHMALEGIYRWLVFLPSTQQEGRPVPNRYFGVFNDGTLKCRGLMCRRRDTPPLVRRAQEAVLALLSQVEDWEEGRARWPELQEAATRYRLRLEQGLVRPEDLVITKVLSRPLDQFRVQTHTSLAAGQLQAAGIRLVPRGKTALYCPGPARPAGNPGTGRAVYLRGPGPL